MLQVHSSQVLIQLCSEKKGWYCFQTYCLEKSIFQSEIIPLNPGFPKYFVFLLYHLLHSSYYCGSNTRLSVP